jgi:hypothetical protein
MPGYISEVAFEGGASDNFVEIVMPHGTDTSAYTIVIYDTDGTVQSTMSLGAIDVTTGGNDGYVLDDTDVGFVDIRDNSAIALVDDTGTVIQFLGFKTAVTASEGPANGQTSDLTGDISSGGHSVETSDGGATYADTATPNAGTIPCYAPGTLIDTPDGPCAVETLKVGDLVITLDHGPQAIRWVHSGHQPLEAVDVDAKPVLIAAGALGHKLPGQDLIVSPQHRMLVGGHRQLQGQFKNEALVPAKSLTKLKGIRHMRGKPKITWIHFACDRHEIVFANGCLSESLLLGPMVVNGLTAAAQQEVNDIFGPAPTPGAALNGPPALECLKVGAAQWQLEKGFKLKRPQISKEIKIWDVDVEI